MNTKNKKNRIILCICSIFLLVASIFSFIPFVTNETKPVYADTVTYDAYFRGSPVTFSSSMYEFYYNTNNEKQSVYWQGGLNSYQVASHGNYSNYFPFLYTVLTVHIRHNANGVVEFLPMLQHPEIVDGQGYASTNGVMNLYNYSFLNTAPSTLEESKRYFNGYIEDGIAYGNWFAIDGSNGLSSGQHLLATMDASSFNGGWFYEFNQHVSGVLFFYTRSTDTIDISKLNKVEFDGQSVKYIDVNNNWLSFTILTSNYRHTPTTYYFANNLFTDNEYYQSGYDGGYSDGYAEGYIIGSDESYSDGYNTGKNDGYNLGYNTGVENSNKYTFTALISSVIDVPVKAFTSLFNFEILGVNLSGFFLGLLTCCITIAIIRLIF